MEAAIRCVFLIIALAVVYEAILLVFRYRLDLFRQRLLSVRQALSIAVAQGIIDGDQPAYKMLRSRITSLIRLRRDLTTLHVFFLWREARHNNVVLQSIIGLERHEYELIMDLEPRASELIEEMNTKVCNIIMSHLPIFKILLYWNNRSEAKGKKIHPVLPDAVLYEADTLELISPLRPSDPRVMADVGLAT